MLSAWSWVMPRKCRVDVQQNCCHAAPGGPPPRLSQLRVSISKFCCSSPSLESTLCDLDLTRTPIGNKGAAALAAALPDVRLLRRLELRECGFEDAGATCLMHVVASCPHLQHLDVSWNLLGAPACAALVTALPAAESLETLRLGRCGITDDDGSLLCHALAFCPRWCIVDLSGAPSSFFGCVCAVTGVRVSRVAGHACDPPFWLSLLMRTIWVAWRGVLWLWFWCGV